MARPSRPDTAVRGPDGVWGIFEHSVNPMLLADDQRRYRDANDAACRHGFEGCSSLWWTQVGG